MTLAGLLVFSSCGKEESEILTTEAYVSNGVLEVQERAGSGKRGCFELVYPVEITLPDGTTEAIDDLEDLKTTLKTWKENNPDATERPSLVYPIEVINKDGELITVASQEEMRELKKDCKKGNGPHGGQLKDCFEVVFPVSVEFPNGSVLEAATRMTLKIALREWKENNPNATERPSLVFPIEIFQDGETITVATKEELHAIKEECLEE